VIPDHEAGVACLTACRSHIAVRKSDGLLFAAAHSKHPTNCEFFIAGEHDFMNDDCDLLLIARSFQRRI
jgi:hypothetical protein